MKQITLAAMVAMMLGCAVLTEDDGPKPLTGYWRDPNGLVIQFGGEDAIVRAFGSSPFGLDDDFAVGDEFMRFVVRDSGDHYSAYIVYLMISSDGSPHVASTPIQTKFTRTGDTIRYTDQEGAEMQFDFLGLSWTDNGSSGDGSGGGTIGDGSGDGGPYGERPPVGTFVITIYKPEGACESMNSSGVAPKVFNGAFTGSKWNRFGEPAPPANYPWPGQEPVLWTWVNPTVKTIENVSDLTWRIWPDRSTFPNYCTQQGKLDISYEGETVYLTIDGWR